METAAIQEIMIVGGGIMGGGIAQVVARAGLQATVVDIDEPTLEQCVARVDRGLMRAVEKGLIDDADRNETRARIAFTTDLADAASRTDHVIETVIEDLDTKLSLLSRLDELCRDDVIFASNTSQFAISRLGAATNRADRVIGSHWFNPPPVMGLIEIVRGVETSELTLQTTLDLARRYGKQTVVCKRDTQGFVTSRLIALLIVEAVRIVEEGIADVEDVNRACMLAFNHAQGPLDTADSSGLDTVDRVLTAMVDHYGERFRSPQLLRELVNAGHLGRKTGRGFRDYGVSR